MSERIALQVDSLRDVFWSWRRGDAGFLVCFVGLVQALVDTTHEY